MVRHHFAFKLYMVFLFVRLVNNIQCDNFMVRRLSIETKVLNKKRIEDGFVMVCTRTRPFVMCTMREQQ